MLNSGTLLQNRYLIQSQLGQGGMGSVYRAFDQTMNKVSFLFCESSNFFQKKFPELFLRVVVHFVPFCTNCFDTNKVKIKSIVLVSPNSQAYYQKAFSALRIRSLAVYAAAEDPSRGSSDRSNASKRTRSRSASPSALRGYH